MSADLRVALRIQANSGNSRREIAGLNRDLRLAGKEGARALATEGQKAQTSISGIGRAGVGSFKAIRQAMRDSTKSGREFRTEVIQTGAGLKDMGQAARRASQETKATLRSAEREGITPLRTGVDRTSTSFRQLARAATSSLRTIKSVAAATRAEIGRVRGMMSGVNGHLAGAGLGIGVGLSVANSAKTDRRMIQLGQTANMSPAQNEDMRKEIFRVSKSYGNDPDSILGGAEALLAGGLSPKAAKSSIDAIGQASALRNADPTILAGAGMAAKEAYGFDLENPATMLDILQKMTIAGDAAKAELTDLGDIFSKVGGNANAAGFKFHQSLGLIESLSNVEPNAENLRTMTGNFLSVFNTGTYQQQVSKTTGVEFFNKDKSRRDPFEVIADLRKKYDKMPDDKSRASFFNVVFKSMDRDAVTAWRWMLTGDRQSNMVGISDKVHNAAPIFNQQLKENTGSATGTAGRMRATLRDATDRMSRPINEAFANMGSYLLDDLNLSGEQMIGLGAATAIGGYYTGRGLKKGAGALLNKLPGMGNPLETMQGIAVGKVLEEATGVTSVFVTNWPGNMGGGVSPDISLGSTGKGKTPSNSAKWMKAVEPYAKYAMYRFPQLAGAFIPGSTPQGDDSRLDQAQRSKLSNDDQRTYQTAFYRNRIALADKNPEQSQDWLSSEAQRLAHHETGLTASGLPIGGASSWAAGIADRAVSAGMATQAANARLQAMMTQSSPADWMSSQAQRLTDTNSMTAGGSQPGGAFSGMIGTEGAMGGVNGLNGAISRLEGVLNRPFVFEVRTDTNTVFAEFERRVGVQMRRGG
ncbi:phage tail tape measure protein [Pseudomonas sp. PSPC3-3]|uniref:phage tail tape measure protein n=1 Tax=unclassified Pseudomonas TaxID=196821 RepID=UPI003CF91FEE